MCVAVPEVPTLAPFCAPTVTLRPFVSPSAWV
jgi:hypothetical protein